MEVFGKSQKQLLERCLHCITWSGQEPSVSFKQLNA